jgi:hypothetical protein
LASQHVVQSHVNDAKDRNRRLVNLAVLVLGLAAAAGAWMVMRRQPHNGQD